MPRLRPPDNGDTYPTYSETGLWKPRPISPLAFTSRLSPGIPHFKVRSKRTGSHTILSAFILGKIRLTRWLWDREAEWEELRGSSEGTKKSDRRRRGKS